MPDLHAQSANAQSAGVESEEAFCPKCGKKDRHPAERGGFLEIGEWDGKSYEEEFHVSGHSCSGCGHTWYEE